MTAAEADFYDRDLENPKSRALRPLSESPWMPLYQEAAGWIETWQPVYDLGCGTGRFAALLKSYGHNAAYVGLDFSPLAVEEATGYLNGREHGLGTFQFDVADLRAWKPPEILNSSTTFVCLETLEHIDDDLAVVAKVPPGHRLIFSVPNFGSASHVRRFATAGELWRRYDRLLLFRRWSYIDLSDGRPGRAIHLAEAVRRSESWN